jgi:hypothetical protein
MHKRIYKYVCAVYPRLANWQPCRSMGSGEVRGEAISLHTERCSAYAGSRHDLLHFVMQGSI